MDTSKILDLISFFNRTPIGKRDSRLVNKAEFEEEKHPRGEDGKFSSGGGGRKQKPDQKAPTANEQRMAVDSAMKAVREGDIDFTESVLHDAGRDLIKQPDGEIDDEASARSAAEVISRWDSGNKVSNAIVESQRQEKMIKYIRREGSQYTVYSESGKPMGTYDSEKEAKERLQQIEQFKQEKAMATQDLLKGVQHTVDSLMEVMKSIKEYEPEKDLTENERKELRRLTNILSSLVEYFKDSEERGYVEP